MRSLARHRRWLALSAALLLLVPGLVLAQATREPDKPHPIIGKWTWTRVANDCTEVYDFRPDGTLVVQSGAEKTDNTYEIASEPDRDGFYKVTMRVVKDYGGKDCGDAEDDSTGDTYTNYVLFDPSMGRYVACAKPAFDACIGPLRRLP